MFADRLCSITTQDQVANDWYTLYQITTLTDEDIAKINGTLNQKSIAKFKQQKNHPPADPVLNGGDLEIITGRFQDKGNCIADESVLLVFTDPPYDMTTACTRWGRIL